MITPIFVRSVVKRPLLAVLAGQTVKVQTDDTVFVPTNACKWSSNTLGIWPPAISTPASMFFSIACPVRFALVMKHFGRAFEWGIWEGINPCKGIRANREVSRARFLKGNELRRFLAAVDAEPCETSRDLIYLALLTGARQGNVVSMRWIELDLDEAEWQIPAAKHKSGDSQIVPLAPEAVAILRQRWASASGPWVFPAQRADNATGHFSGIHNA